jgi:hypothetical protein
MPSTCPSDAESGQPGGLTDLIVSLSKWLQGVLYSPKFWIFFGNALTDPPNLGPAGGEIDIVEGVNNQPQNQATLHTSEGCVAQSDPNHPSTGQLTNANCGVDNGDNTGCGFTDTDSDNSYGQAFNDNGGGVYVMQWVETGISVWFFPRNNIPADITANHPTPWTWKDPFAHWASAGCDTNQFFNNNYAIFDMYVFRLPLDDPKMLTTPKHPVWSVGGFGRLVDRLRMRSKHGGEHLLRIRRWARQQLPGRLLGSQLRQLLPSEHIG